MSARVGIAGAVLVVAGAAMVAGGTVLGGGFWPARMVAASGGGSAVGTGGYGGYGPGMMGGYGAGGYRAGGYGGFGPGMMGGYGGIGATGTTAPGPGEAGFTAGTQASPRIVQVVAGPGYTFTPATIAVARGETVTFEVTSVGPLVHEFMVGPADAVAADRDGTPEAAGIGMMQTKSVTYTFDRSGPYAFACHAPGHYEAGMRGTITVVG